MEHGVAAAAVVVGALWAYFRFVRFRTLKPRLKFTFEWTRSEVNHFRSLLILTLKLVNRGRSKVVLREDRDPRCFLKYALIRESGSAANFALLNVPPRRLEHLDTVFAAHRWIEPGETIDDVKLMEVDRTGLLAIQIEVLVFGEKKYSAPAAISLLGVPASSGSDSEDEQDEYEEIECLIEGLGSVLARILRLGEDARESMQGLMEKIERCRECLDRVTQGQPSGESTSKLLSEGERLKREAEEVLRSRGSG
jgi:hypothetical protein